MHVIDLRKSRVTSVDNMEEYVVKPTGISKIEIDSDCIRIYTLTGYFILIDEDSYIQIREKLTGLITA